MKYQIEYCPNPDVLNIDVDQRLIRGSILVFMSDESDHTKKEFEQERNGNALANFCQTVGELDGMEEEIFFGRYHIQVKKTPMFSWETLLPTILDALRTFIAKDGEIEEAAPAKRPTEEYLKALREQGCDV